jgi:ketosteroid isomerase-like protein
MTTPQLPDSIAHYFRAAEAGDTDTLVACFTDNAEVTDEGAARRGHAAIRHWREEVATKYTYTLEVLGSQTDGEGRYVVATKLEGDFPGGVAYLDQRFMLHDGRIAALHIA